MTTTPAAGPADAPGRPAGWLVLTASERGASHVAASSPNQDAVATERAGAAGVVAAVADGHGHSRHLRSARGSRLAVRIGCQAAQELADRLEQDDGLDAQHQGHAAAATEADELAKLTEEFLVPAVVQRWREAVLADVAEDPFTDAEQEHRYPGDDPAIAYGSTLLLGMALHDWLILAQIGDGDIVGVRADGRSVQPVPADPQLDGLVTTSLCGTDPRSDFRIAVVNTSADPLLAVLLATDGYGNAQVVEEWPEAFSQDLTWLLQDRDAGWLAAQLPSWAARCASADGSADDTTVALMVSPAKAALRPPPAAQDNADGSEETTIPAVPHADTAPAQVPTLPESLEPVTMRQLAHRTAQEPVILERLAAQEEHEPPTTKLPKLDRDGGAGGGRGNGGNGPEDGGGNGGGNGSSSEPGSEPPTTEWTPPERGPR